MDDPYIDILGFGHDMGLDIYEQTVIEDVMANIPINPIYEEEVMLEPVKPIEPVTEVKESKENAIEAADVSSLLEQFEEASMSFETEPSGSVTISSVASDTSLNKTKLKNGSFEKKELTCEVLQRLKSSQKPKTTVMLPMMVPAKRGRGRAMTRGHPVAMPVNCTPRRLQRVMMQNAELKDSLALSNEDMAALTDTKASGSSEEKVKPEKSDEKSVEEVKPEKVESSGLEVKLDGHVKTDHDYVKGSDDPGASEHSDSKCTFYLGNELEEGEVFEDDVEIEPRNRKSHVTRDEAEEPGQYFNKLPSYCTALSIPTKQIRKTASCAYNGGGITVHDYIERAISPVHDTSAYSKLPDYCSSFTNSTKYDSLSDFSLSKASSGYSSLSQSPSRRSSRSPSSESKSRSRSRSWSLSKSRKQRNYRRRRSSCSPCSEYSSSSSSSRSRSSGRSSSCSSSMSCSTCVSRSPSHNRSVSRSSEDRAWSRERRFRSERSHRSRGSRRRSRSYTYSRSRSGSRHHRHRSGSKYSRHRSRDLSRERLREERKKMREEEKQQQMKERRIVYVGGLPGSYSRHQLRGKFSRFGEIENVQLHFREHGDNYGFVTFAYTCDAFAAIEKGNSVPGLEKFDLCFGGRRQFCDVEYADLDGNKEVEEEYELKPRKAAACDFDELLRQAQAKLKKS